MDEPDAFPAREWLRKLVVGKAVRFETRKQGASAGDRVYGWLYLDQPDGQALHLAVECVRQGHATPKQLNSPKTTDNANANATPVDDAANQAAQYEQALMQAFTEAKDAKRGIHAETPLVRKVLNAGDDYALLSLVQACQKSQTRLKCVVEYIFDGSRFRCQVVDPNANAIDKKKQYQYATFTLMLAGASCPRTANAKSDTPAEPFSEQARQFVTARLLQRELDITLVGTDKSGGAAVGIIHHPAGNIAVELLKRGFAKMTDWTVRLMPVADVPALRFAENQAKRTLQGIWHSYAPPVLSTTGVSGQVIEVLSGDTILILPTGQDYTSDDVLKKVSLASVRTPRLGRADGARPDEPMAQEAKDRLRQLLVGKKVSVVLHYERDIPLGNDATEKRAYGTVSVGKHPDVAQILMEEGLAMTQRHRDDDPTSPRYDELRAAEAVAKAAKKGVHKEQPKEGKTATHSVNDMTNPQKAKAYSGALMRAGSTKAVVDYVFNGALFKLLVPGENCYIRFAPSCIRCPQASSRSGKTAEPFGDESKRFSRLQVLQRSVEISCTNVTNSGIFTGTMHIKQGNSRIDYATELLGAGLATLDARKVEYGEVPKEMLDVEAKARENKIGLWSIAPAPAPASSTSEDKSTAGAGATSTDKETTIRLSEIRSGSHFYYHVVGDDAAKVMEESMKAFTQNHGTDGATCEVKVNKVVAALFDDGRGKSWYRAKIVEKKSPTHVDVLFLDHGNVATVPVSTHLRPLDLSLGTDRIPPIAKEASLALTVTRSLETDDGVDAARYLQASAWDKDVRARLIAPDESGRMAVVLFLTEPEDTKETLNSEMIALGLARVAPYGTVNALARAVKDGSSVKKLASELGAMQEKARKSRVGMWRYGDVGDDDDEGPI